MPKRVAFLYDFGSAPAYLAYMSLPGIAARTGATIDYQPVLAGGIFKATGNRAPIEVATKAAWFWADLLRFSQRRGVAFHRNSHFPFSTLYLMRGAVAAQHDGQLAPYSDAIFKAMWVDGQNLGDPRVFARALDEAGLNMHRFLTAIETDAIKTGLRVQTEAAVARGAFGVPTFFVDDVLHFGQDRLDFVEEQLAG